LLPTLPPALRKIKKSLILKKNSKKKSNKDKLKSFEIYNQLYQRNMCIKYPIYRIKIDRVIALRWEPEKWLENLREKLLEKFSHRLLWKKQAIKIAEVLALVASHKKKSQEIHLFLKTFFNNFFIYFKEF